jgi:hypothetical protein
MHIRQRKADYIVKTFREREPTSSALCDWVTALVFFLSLFFLCFKAEMLFASIQAMCVFFTHLLHLSIAAQ